MAARRRINPLKEYTQIPYQSFWKNYFIYGNFSENFKMVDINEKEPKCYVKTKYLNAGFYEEK